MGSYLTSFLHPGFFHNKIICELLCREMSPFCKKCEISSVKLVSYCETAAFVLFFLFKCVCILCLASVTGIINCINGLI